MENSAKALLMASGVLVTMLIVTLLFYFKGKLTEYYNDQGKIDDIANVADFNKQFTNYERNKVYGYEIISLANMVEDYNTRHSGADNAPNDEKYTPFTLVVTFEGSGTAVQDKIWYNLDGGVNHLFNNNDILTQSETSNQVVDRILKATEIENLYGVSEAAKLAKSINKLIVKEDPNDIDYQVQSMMKEQNVSFEKAILILKRKAVADYRAIIKNNEPVPYESSEVEGLYAEMKNILLYGLYGKYPMSIRQYYEYYQFKKAVFECINVNYDNDVGGTGRIIGMTFKFTGKVE